MATQDYIQQVVAEFAAALAPLAAAVGDTTDLTSLFGSLGWDFDDGAAASLVSALGTVVTDVQRFASDASAGAELETLVVDVGAVAASLIACAPAATGTLPAPLDLPQFWQALPDDLLELLLFDYLDQNHPLAFGLLAVLGVVYLDAQAADPVTGRAAFQRKSVGVDRLASFIGNPAQALRTDFGWGAAFDHEAAVWALGALLRGVRAGSAVSPATASLLDDYFSALNPQRGGVDQLVVSAPSLSSGDGTAVAKAALVVLPVPPATDNTAAPEGLVLRPTFFGQASDTFPLGEIASLALSGSATDTPTEIYLRPSGVSAVVSVTGVQAQLTAALSVSPATPLVIAGDPTGSRVELWKAHVSLGVTAAEAGIVIETEAVFDQLRLVVDAGEGDGFIAQVLGGATLQADVGPGVAWSSGTGLRFAGQGLPQVDIPLHVSLAFIELDMLSVRPRPGGDGAVVVDIGLTGSLSLGPFAVSVQDMGVSVQVRGTDAASPGNLGSLDLSFGFKSPDGIGLALQAPPVTGTGFLTFDEANARYLGALALAVGDVAMSAVGVLDTELPGGGQGYSLIVVASADFPPVELGFGFSLVGIGGLVGVNRTTNVPALQALARAGQLDSLMFPADLAHRAPQVAASLEQVFPAAQGHFIVGPAVRIEWGTQGIVDAEVGVFIELSDSGGGLTLLRVALLGWVHLTLPDVLAPVADLTLDVLGVADLTAKTISLDAGLRNSTIASFPLTGQAALRASWGASPTFVFAVGGFNPHFQVPSGFPALQRLALSVGGSDPRLRLSAYLALTSNTVQLGSSADLYASAGPAAVAASLSFDALVQFRPFGLIVDLTINATVLLGGSPVLALSLDLHLTGPAPWTVTGSAHFQVLFCSFTVPISINVGPAPTPQPPQTVDLDGNLTTALADTHSWQTGPPAGQGVVTVRGQNAASPAVHPLGTLTVRQNAVPLEQHIECYGAEPLDAPCTYQITAATIGGLPAQAADATDFFAPAQFQIMTDAQKLSAPSFEAMTAGTTLGSAALSLAQAPGTAGSPATVVDTASSRQFDVLMLDCPDPPVTPGPAATTGPTVVATTAPPVTLPGTVLAAQLPAAAVAVNGAGGRGPARYAAPGCGIGVEQPSYAVVGMNLAAIGSTTTISIGIPTAVAAVHSQPTGVAGQDWQVVYTSEVPG